MEQQALQTDNLTKKYRNFTALSGVSVTVNKGDIYGLVGRNGAGKTTLFKLIMGLTEPSGGSIMINGSNDLLNARQKIGFMINLAFYGYLSAYENTEYFRLMKNIKDKTEAERVLKLVGLAGEKKKFKDFSMGMKQRLGIANALLGSPQIVILDEPVNGLDPQGVADVRKVIKDLNQKHGITFVISSHILSELDLIATRFGFIDHGVLLEEISYKDLHKRSKVTLEEYFLNLVGGAND